MGRSDADYYRLVRTFIVITLSIHSTCVFACALSLVALIASHLAATQAYSTSPCIDKHIETGFHPHTHSNERDVSIAQMVQLAEDEHRKRLLDRLLPQVAHRIRDFVVLLQTPPKRPAIQNTVALLQPPFGQTRLQVCAMLTVLLRTENAAIERA